MTAPDGSAAEAYDFAGADFSEAGFTDADCRAPDCSDDGVRATVVTFPGAFAATPVEPAVPANSLCDLPADLAEGLADLAQERGMSGRALLDAARLLLGDRAACDVAAAELALAAAGRGPRRLARAADLARRETRIEMLEYRNKALTGALERVSFQPLAGGLREVRDAAQVFGFANEWCFDEDRVTRRFRELAPVYHPDTGVVADRERMAQLIEARNLLIRHVRTAYAAAGWVGKRRG